MDDCGKMNVHSVGTFESVPMKKKPCQPNQADPVPYIRLKPRIQYRTLPLHGHCII